MDIYCPKCAEPWDIDSLHDAADDLNSTFDQVRVRFQQVGCVALGMPVTCEPAKDPAATFRAEVAGVMYDLLGDDIDGAASMFEDYF